MVPVIRSDAHEVDLPEGTFSMGSLPHHPPYRVAGPLHIQASRHAGDALVPCGGQ